MAHFSTLIDARASAKTAFDYLADFSNVRHWDPNASDARRVSEGPIGEGAAFEVRIPLLGREIRLLYRITRFEPHAHLELQAETPWLRSLDRIDVESRPHGGSLVRYDADLRPLGPAYLLDLPLHLGFQVAGSRAARGLERALAALD